MAIDLSCPNCGAEIEADEQVAGTTAQCPGCHGTILVPKRGICAGTRLGHFTVERKLGAGGMGEVWLARQQPMNRAVALKILPPAMATSRDFVDRFMQEVQLAAKLEHPHIVTAFDAGSEQDVIYLAMSFVDGEGLDARLAREKTIAEKEALRIVRGVAEALAYAWDSHRILHRDIKPANIMLTASGQPKLMDLGISKSMSEDVSLTMTGYIVGTPQYMSPEQARAEEGETLDFRADVYSLGATLYHLVTGTLPFSSTTAMGMLSKHITEPLVSPRKRNPQVSEACAALIETMMAKSRDDRQKSWAEVVADIDRVLSGHMPTTMRPAMGKSVVMPMRPDDLKRLHQERIKRLAQSHAMPAAAAQAKAARPSGKRPGLIAAAAVLILAVAGTLVLLVTARGKPAPPPPAPAAAAPVKPDPAVEQAKQQAELWAHAESFAREHPQDLDQAIANYRTVRERTAGSKYEMMADEAIRKLEGEKTSAAAAALRKVMDDLRARAQPLLDAEDFAAAAEVYSAYNGALAAESTSQRDGLANQYRGKAEALAQTRQAEADAARQKVDAALAATAEQVLAGKAAEALARWDALGRESLPAAEQARVKDAQALARGLAGADALLLTSFAAQAGQETDLVLGGKPYRLKILSARDGVVQAERPMGQASISASFTLKQVAAAEKCRRLQGQTTPEVCALYAAEQAQAEGRAEDALKAAAGAGVLAGPLAAALGGRREADHEALAEQALRATLRKLGITGEALEWAAVSDQMQKVNPSAASVAAVQRELAAYAGAHGGTRFAAAQSNLVEQVVAYLAVSAMPVQPAPAVKPVSTLSKRDDDDKPDKDEAAILARVEEARLRTGPVIRVSPKGGDGTVTLEEGIRQLKSGMVLHLAGGKYPSPQVSAGGSAWCIEGLKNVVVEGESNATMVSRVVVLRFESCDAPVVRSLAMDNLYIGPNSITVDSRVDGSFYPKSEGGNPPLIANSVVKHVDVQYPIDIRRSTVYRVCLRSTLTAAKAPTTLTDSIVINERGPFRIGYGTSHRLVLRRCAVFSDSPENLGILYEGDSNPGTKELPGEHATLTSLKPYVTGTDVTVALIQFVGSGVWPKDPAGFRLAPGSAGRGAGPGGRDLGAFIGPNGMPIPYPGEPGATRIKTATDLHAALKAANPGYKGDGEVLVEKGQITEVSLSHHVEVKDISPLRGLALRTLDLNSCKHITDFSPLAGMPLTCLDVGNCPMFGDGEAAVLASAPLVKLTAQATPLSDLGVLRGKKLTHLLVGTTKVSDLEPLRGMRLEELSISRTGVTNLTALAGMPLLRLAVHNTRVSDLSPLAGMPLGFLTICDTDVTDLSVLRSMPLDVLHFTPSKTVRTADIHMLRSMGRIRRVATRWAPTTSVDEVDVAEFWRRYDAGEYK